MPINATPPSAADYERTIDQHRAYIKDLEAERDAAVENAKVYCDQWKVAVDARLEAMFERDALRATVERVRALADERMSSSCIHVNDLVVSLRAALDAQKEES
jgi:hypothetical protein